MRLPRSLWPRRPFRAARPIVGAGSMFAKPSLECLEDRNLLATRVLTLALDPALSRLTFAGDILGQYPLVAQAGGDSLTTDAGGTINLLYDDVAQTIDITSAQITPRNLVNAATGQTRNFLPPAPGFANASPAQFAAQTSLGGFAVRGAIRNLLFNLDSPVVSLDGDQTWIVSTVDALIPQGRLDYSLWVNGNFDLSSATFRYENQAARGAWRLNESDGRFTLELPLDVAGALDLSPVGVQGNVNYRVSGALVASAYIVQPDLVVTAASIVETSASHGDEVTVRYTLANLGSASSGPVDVDLRFASVVYSPTYFEDPYFSRSLGIDTVSAVAAGSAIQREVRVRLPVLQQGFNLEPLTRWIGLVVDPGNHVRELDEVNNKPSSLGINYAAVAVLTTELAPVSLKIRGDVSQPLDWGESLDVEYAIQNTGPGAAGPFRVEFRLHPAYQSDFAVIGSAYWEGLIGGGTKVTRTRLTLPEIPLVSLSNRYVIEMIVDADNQVVESNDDPLDGYGNYLTAWADEFSIFTPGPNLVVSGVAIVEPSPAVGDLVTVRYTLVNAGVAGTGPFYARIGDNGTPDLSVLDLMPSLAPGEQVIRETRYRVTRPTSHGETRAWITVMADSANAVLETSELDNSVGAWVELRQPDLLIADLWVEPGLVDWGDDLKVHYRVENRGTADASGGKLVFSLEARGATRYEYFTFPGELEFDLAAGGVFEGSIALRLPTSDLTDATGQLLLIGVVGAGAFESDRWNNERQSIVELRNPDLVVSSLHLSSDFVYLDRDFAVTVAVVNDGNTAAGPFEVELTVGEDWYSSDQLVLASATIQELAVGQSTTVHLMVRIPSNGMTADWTRMDFSARVDSTSMIKEAFEENNSFVTTARPALPDLRGISLSVETADFDYTDEIVLDYTVANVGAADAGAFSLLIGAAKSRFANTTIELGTVNWAGLAAGARASGSIRVSLAGYRDDDLPAEIYIQSHLILAEPGLDADPFNNSGLGLGIDVLAIAPRLADLVPIAVRIEEAAVDWGDEITVAYSIVNRGAAWAPASLIDFLPSSAGNVFAPTTQALIPSLAPGERYDGRLSILLPAMRPANVDPRDYKLIIEVDSDERVPERNGDNNRGLEVGVGIAVVPLVLSDLVMEPLAPPEPVPGQSDVYRLTARVENQGEKASAATRVDLKFLQGTRDFGDYTYSGVAQIPVLAPGEWFDIDVMARIGDFSHALRPLAELTVVAKESERDLANNTARMDVPLRMVELEPNETLSEAPLLPVGTMAQGSLAGPSDIDLYRIELWGWAQLHFTARFLINADAQSSDSTASIALRLLDTFGGLLRTINPCRPDGMYLETGEYLLEVTSLSGHAGDYEVGLYTGSEPVDSFSSTIYATAALDWDHDGIIDGATLEYDGSRGTGLAILRGIGTGQFIEVEFLPVAFSSAYLYQQDFDGDGWDDLLATDGETKGTLFLTRSGGVTRRDVLLPNGTRAESLQWGDVDGDGLVDLVTQRKVGGERAISVYFSDGNGGFQQPPARTLLEDAPGSQYSWGTDFVQGDFNGDHKLDLIAQRLGQTGAELNVYLGSGDGYFTFAALVEFDRYLASFLIEAGDFDADGDLDLVIGESNDQDAIIILSNDGHGSFSPTAEWKIPNSIVTFGDMTEISQIDVVELDGRPGADIVLYGTNTPYLRSAMVYLSDPVGGFRAGKGFQALNSANVAVGDFNQDGLPDLFAGRPVWFGYGDGTFKTGEAVNRLAVDQVAPLALDVNGDGRIDLVSVQTDPSSGEMAISVLVGQGTGVLQSIPSAPVPLEGRPAELAAADLNGDGRVDLVLVTENWSGSNYEPARISVFLGLGDGRFTRNTTLAVSEYAEYGYEASSLVLADFDGDERVDIAFLVDHEYRLTLLFGRGDGTFESETSVRNVYAQDFLPLDIDHDGLLDLLFVEGNGFDVRANRGDREFLPLIRMDRVGGSGLGRLVAGDFNRDGRVDIFADSLLLVNEDLLFVQLPRITTRGGNLTQLATGDFDGDGWIDIVGMGPSSGTLQILWGQHGPSFALGEVLSLGNNSARLSSVTTADFNGDGRTDLAVASDKVGGSVTVLLNAGARRFIDADRLPPDRKGHTSTFVDVDGDGLADSIVLDGSGRVLIRERLPGTEIQFQPPLVLNPNFIASDFTPLTAANGSLTALALLDPRSFAIRLFAWSESDGFVELDLGDVYAPDYPLRTGIAPTRLAAADVDGNGSADLVVTDGVSDTATVYFARADGSFSGSIPRRVMAAGSTPADISSGDLDGDGKLDLFVVNSSSADISVFAGEENSPVNRFAAQNWGYSIGIAQNRIEVAAPHQSRRLALADFNEDGRPDLLVANQGTRSIALLAGDSFGNLTFVRSNVGWGITVEDWLVGDFDGDAHADVAALVRTAADQRELRALFGDGRGDFTLTTIATLGELASSLASSDLDEDGDIDLIVGNRLGDLSTYLNKGLRGFDQVRPAGRSVVLNLVDIDGDGQRDVLYANENLDRVSVEFAIAGRQFAEDARSGILAPGAVTVADLDGDGNQDLVVANGGADQVLVYLGLGAGRFGPALRIAVGDNPVGVTASDLDGDGDMDLLVANKDSNSLTIVLAKVGANRTASERAISAWSTDSIIRINDVGSGPVATDVFDTDADGIVDLVVTNSGGTLTRIPGTTATGESSNGFFTSDTSRFVSVPLLPPGALPGAIGPGRFLELTAGTGLSFVGTSPANDAFFVLSNVLDAFQGSGERVRFFTSDLFSQPTALAATDFNHDGALDLVVANRADGRFTLLAGGRGGFEVEDSFFVEGLRNPAALALAGLEGSTLRLYAVGEADENVFTFEYIFGGPKGPGTNQPGEPSNPAPALTTVNNPSLLFLVARGVTNLFQNILAIFSNLGTVADGVRPEDVSESGALSRRSLTNNGDIADAIRLFQSELAKWAKWLEETLGAALGETLDAINGALGTRITTEDVGRLGGEILRILAPPGWMQLGDLIGTLWQAVERAGQEGAEEGSKQDQKGQTKSAAIDAVFAGEEGGTDDAAIEWEGAVHLRPLVAGATQTASCLGQPAAESEIGLDFELGWEEEEFGLALGLAGVASLVEERNKKPVRGKRAVAAPRCG